MEYLKKISKKIFNKNYIKKEVVSWFWVILIVVAFRSTIAEPYRVPTGSMIPSIMIGDFILVNKLSYGIKVPFTELSFFDEPVYLWKNDGPDYDDIIVFRYPKNPDISYIKRIVGRPGDKIKIINNKLFINGREKVFNNISIGKQREIINDLESKFKRYPLEIKTNGEFNIMFNTKNKRTIDKEVTVPKGHYFVMGDNRDFSSDSRVWGFVPFKYVKGKAVMVWLSWRLPILGDTAKTSKFRYWRIGTLF